MVEFQVPINKKQRLAYIPKILVDSLGYKLTIIPDTKAALMFASGATLEELLQSLHVIEEIVKGRKKAAR
jgi:hypothetical protein